MSSLTKWILRIGIPLILFGFFVLAVGIYEPFPFQYRLMTNGHEMYKIQEKNWFLPWEDYRAFEDGEIRTKYFRNRFEAERELQRLRKDERQRRGARQHGWVEVPNS